MLCAACDPARYAGLGVEGWHASCQENLQQAMASAGIDHIEVPQPINLFMDTPPLPDGTIDWGPTPTSAGQGVTLRAELDLFPRRLGVPAGHSHDRRPCFEPDRDRSARRVKDPVGGSSS